MTSEAFLRHRQVNAVVTLDDQKKLIKKDEVPVRIVPLTGIEQV